MHFVLVLLSSLYLRESLRLAEINLLKSTIAEKDFRQSYLVVIGEMGVEKTCLLNTATSKMPGVINVEARPKHSQDDIIKNTLTQLENHLFNLVFPFHSAKRVVFWYRLFTFGRSPIIVINATEREAYEGYASLTGAVRTLIDVYKLRVVVDGSPNSLNESLLQTMREFVVHINPKSREIIWKMKQVKDLFKYIKEAGLDDIVFAVLGGIPLEYFWYSNKLDLQDGHNPRQVIGSHLCAEIYDANKII